MEPRIVALIAALVLPAFAIAQPVPDHLKCYKVKDSRAKATYTADLGGLVSEPGCLIKVPGKMLCVGATKTNVNPPPPGGTDESGPAGRFLCYKVKCPKAVLAPLPWQDQFGMGTITPSAPKLLCAPEILATTTSTSTSTSTTMCTPMTCGALGANCGLASDGCGGTLDCGTCTPPEICTGGAGVPNRCGGCLPQTCGATSCGLANDGCGGTLDCGSCTAPETCGGGGVLNQCGSGGCTPTTCASLGLDCGPFPDGCGGTIDCGTCTAPLTCGGAGKQNHCG